MTIDELKAERARLWDIVHEEHVANTARIRATITCPEDLLRPHVDSPAETAMARIQRQIMDYEAAEWRKENTR